MRFSQSELLLNKICTSVLFQSDLWTDKWKLKKLLELTQDQRAVEMDKDPWMKVSVVNSAPFISRFGCGQISICFQYDKFKNIKQNIHLQMHVSFPTPVFRNIFVMILKRSKTCHP